MQRGRVCQAERPGGSQSHSQRGRLNLGTLGSMEGGRQEKEPMRASRLVGDRAEETGLGQLHSQCAPLLARSVTGASSGAGCTQSHCRLPLPHPLLIGSLKGQQKPSGHVLSGWTSPLPLQSSRQPLAGLGSLASLSCCQSEARTSTHTGNRLAASHGV